MSWTPLCKHISFTPWDRLNEALSITRIDLAAGYLPQWWSSSSIKSSKTEASVDPWKMRERIIPSWAYVGRIWYRWPRWNLSYFLSVGIHAHIALTYIKFANPTPDGCAFVNFSNILFSQTLIPQQDEYLVSTSRATFNGCKIYIIGKRPQFIRTHT